MIYKHKLKDFMITGTYFFSEIKTNVSSGKFILLINKRDKIERKDHKSFLNCGSLKKMLTFSNIILLKTTCCLFGH